MGLCDGCSDQVEAYKEYQDTNYDDPNISHELISGAAAYKASNAYENHIDRNGRPDSYAEAEELLDGFACAFIDREVDVKGLDFIDREKAKHQAKAHFEEHFANGDW